MNKDETQENIPVLPPMKAVVNFVEDTQMSMERIETN